MRSRSAGAAVAASVLVLSSACTPSTAPPSSTSPPSTTLVETVDGLPMGGPALPGAPEEVASRQPLPYCGAEIVGHSDTNPYEGIEIVEQAGECYKSRASAGLPAELITVGLTVEGDPVMTIQRLLPDGREVYFWDATQDNFGPMAWVMTECVRYVASGPTEEHCTTVEL